MTEESQQAVTVTPQIERGWVNYVARYVDGLPLPRTLWYLAAGLAAICLFLINDWVVLGRPMQAAQPFHLVLAVEPIYALALIHFLDIRSGRALARMRQLLIPSDRYAALYEQLTTVPPRLTMLASLAGLLVGLIAVIVERMALPAIFRPFLPSANARLFVEIWLVCSWFIFGALFVHTIHQLRVINHIYTHNTSIDLDNYQPLFHFSRVAAMTAIGLLVIPYAWTLAVPNLLLDPVGVGFAALFPVFALVSFLWPLVGVHNLMVEVKGQALYENSLLLKDLRQRLFDHVTQSAVGGVSDLRTALEAIRAERDALLRVPTWPWQPGTPRSVAVALLLPMMVWLLQRVLQRIVGG